jgi:ketosteroid isomerase-like protein
MLVWFAACGHGAARHRAEEVTMEQVDHTQDGFTWSVFASVARTKVLDSFAHLSQGDPSLALALMAPDVAYTFEGNHALGGTRVSRAGVEKWFGRLLRLLPGKFTIRSVRVVGYPWRSTIYTVFEDEVSPAYGPSYRNRGVQVVQLRWGSAFQIHTYVDTAKVERALAVLAANGVEEAGADPIRE